MLGSAERGKVMLISREIFFQEFQRRPIGLGLINDHDTSMLQTEGQTSDGRTTCLAIPRAALRYASPALP